jgi:hypothetical protein
MPNSASQCDSLRFGKRYRILSPLLGDGAALYKDKSGAMFVYVLVILTFLFSFSLIIGEYYRIHSIQRHGEYNIQRAVNISVEEAMYDSFRQDKLGRLDTARARQNFNNYLRQEIGLNAAMQMREGSDILYTLQLNTITATEDPPRLNVRGVIIIPSAYPFLAGDAEVPFNISSRNVRID